MLTKLKTMLDLVVWCMYDMDRIFRPVRGIL